MLFDILWYFTVFYDKGLENLVNNLDFVFIECVRLCKEFYDCDLKVFVI